MGSQVRFDADPRKRDFHEPTIVLMRAVAASSRMRLGPVAQSLGVSPAVLVRSLEDLKAAQYVSRLGWRPLFSSERTWVRVRLSVDGRLYYAHHTLTGWRKARYETWTRVRGFFAMLGELSAATTNL